jgi:hypothetical protein
LWKKSTLFNAAKTTTPVTGSFNSNLSVAILYNRSSDGVSTDGWIHIVPAGELPNREAGIVQVLDRRSHDSIVANLNSDKQRLGNRWPGLYMGEEHFIYDPTKSSAAFLWAKDFKVESDGVWAKGDATDIGAAAIKNRRFKYTSFVCDPTKPGAIEPLGNNRVRILKIDTVGFTNFANGRELLTPIFNRGLLKNSALGDTVHADKIVPPGTLQGLGLEVGNRDPQTFVDWSRKKPASWDNYCNLIEDGFTDPEQPSYLNAYGHIWMDNRVRPQADNNDIAIARAFVLRALADPTMFDDYCRYIKESGL